MGSSGSGHSPEWSGPSYGNKRSRRQAPAVFFEPHRAVSTIKTPSGHPLKQLSLNGLARSQARMAHSLMRFWHKRPRTCLSF
ncbi:hypothetical protein WJX84_009735 [Apatococcus fuscideae]|uniref:Uncharacterized protein n=1 Tax=Apatococcus fuscideae TaxID=2026836 RepID=A0AAW1SYT9_9CHLO